MIDARRWRAGIHRAALVVAATLAVRQALIFASGGAAICSCAAALVTTRECGRIVDTDEIDARLTVAGAILIAQTAFIPDPADRVALGVGAADRAAGTIVVDTDMIDTTALHAEAGARRRGVAVARHATGVVGVGDAGIAVRAAVTADGGFAGAAQAGAIRTARAVTLFRAAGVGSCRTPVTDRFATAVYQTAGIGIRAAGRALIRVADAMGRR
jgi:hypothetical protein